MIQLRNARAIVLLIAAGTLATGIGMACSADQFLPATDDAGAIVGGGTDAQTDALNDASGDSSTRPPPDAQAKIVYVNSWVLRVRLRLCFALGSASDGSDAVMAALPPFPNKPEGNQSKSGIDPGSAWVIPDFGVDLATKVVVPYVIANSDDIDAGPDVLCSTFLGPHGEGGLTTSAFLQLPPLPIGTFAHNSTFILTMTGCPKHAEQSVAPGCGADYDAGTSNIVFRAILVDTHVTATSSQIGMQLANLSPFSAELQTVPIAHASDAGARFYFSDSMDASLTNLGFVPYPTIGTVANVDLATAMGRTLDFDFAFSDAASLFGPSPEPFSSLLTTSTLVGNALKPGQNYVVSYVGWPGGNVPDDAGPYDFSIPHFIAIPSDPPVKTFQ